MWAGFWNALIWTWKTWSSTKSQSNPSITLVKLILSCHLEVKVPLHCKPGKKWEWKHEWISQFLSWKSHLSVQHCIFSGIKKKTLALLKSNPEGLLIIKAPFQVWSLVVIRNFLNSQFFLLKNSFLALRNMRGGNGLTFLIPNFQICSKRWFFWKCWTLCFFISVKSSFKMTALHFSIQLCLIGKIWFISLWVNLASLKNQQCFLWEWAFLWSRRKRWGYISTGQKGILITGCVLMRQLLQLD